MNIRDMLIKWRPFFTHSNIFYDLFINIGWGITMLLKLLVDSAETILNSVYGILSFTEWQPVKDFFSKQQLKVMLMCLLIGVLVAAGILIMFRQDGERPKLVRNILFAVCVIILMPFAITTLNKFTLYGQDLLNSGKTNTSDKIIASCVVDLKYIDSKNKFASYKVSDNIVSGGAVNGFSGNLTSNVAYINSTEKITKDTTVNNPDLFNSELVMDDDGKIVVKEMEENVIPLINWDLTGWYYRYNIDFITIWISLTATALAILFTAFKVGRLIFEIAVHETITPLIAMADLNSGQRLKTVVKGIINSYCVFFFSSMMLKFFFIGQTYLTSHVSYSFVRAFLLVVFAATVIDGPNLFEKILGIDIGLSSGFKTFASVFMGAKAAGRVASTPLRAAGSVSNWRDRRLNRERNKAERDAARAKKEHFANQNGERSDINNTSINAGSNSNTSTATASNNQNQTNINAAAENPAGTTAAGAAGIAATDAEKEDEKRTSLEGINDTSPVSVNSADMVAANPELSERQKILQVADLENNSNSPIFQESTSSSARPIPEDKPSARKSSGSNQPFRSTRSTLGSNPASNSPTRSVPGSNPASSSSARSIPGSNPSSSSSARSIPESSPASSSPARSIPEGNPASNPPARPSSESDPTIKREKRDEN